MVRWVGSAAWQAAGWQSLQSCVHVRTTNCLWEEHFVLWNQTTKGYWQVDTVVVKRLGAPLASCLGGKVCNPAYMYEPQNCLWKNNFVLWNQTTKGTAGWRVLILIDVCALMTFNPKTIRTENNATKTTNLMIFICFFIMAFHLLSYK